MCRIEQELGCICIAYLMALCYVLRLIDFLVWVTCSGESLYYTTLSVCLDIYKHVGCLYVRMYRREVSCLRSKRLTSELQSTDVR